MKKNLDLTSSPIIKSLIALALPIVFANILQTAYQLTDTFWVGRLGEDAVAAVSLSFPIIFLLLSLGGGFGIAGTILVSHFKGKSQQEHINHVSGQTLLLMMFVSLIVSILGFFISGSLMRLIGAEAAVLPAAVSYLKISFIGLPFVFGFFVYQSLMRAVGDVKVPMFIVLGTVILNFVLDPLFIFGYGPIPPLGVSGAAFATIFTQGLAAIFGLAFLFNGKFEIHIKKKNLKPDFKLIKKLSRLGFPASMEQSTRALGLTIMTFLVASFGTLTVASYGIGMRILSFVIIPALGFSIASSTMVGQNIGAGKKERAGKIALICTGLGFAVLTLVGILTFIFAEQLSSFFIPEETAVILESTKFIQIMALSFGFIAVQQVLTGVFRGAGDTLVPMIMAMVSLWVLQFPLAYVLSKHTALAQSGIWWAFPVTNLIAGIITIIWFFKGSWKKIEITKDIKLKEEVVEETISDEGLQ